jgi:FKBP-type peptidyl-prolyl cis-trans isomerase
LRKLVIALLPVIVLTGCATTNAEPEGPLGYDIISQSLTEVCDVYSGGDAVEQIKVSDNFNETPEVSFPTPLVGTGVETKIYVDGDGGKLVGNQRVSMHFTGFNAATGEQFQGSEFGSETTIIQDLVEGSTPDFCHALTGVSVGSRVAVLLDPQSAHGGAGVEGLSVGPTDGIIFVFDIMSAYLPNATGDKLSAQSGFPTVILAPSGQPGIQIPATDAPAEFMRTETIAGKGEPIAIGDTVVLHYSGWTWDGEQFDSSWERGSPASFTVASEGLIEGFVRALDGATIGSQVIAVIPPELGYGDNAQGSIPAGSTLIFVIDILGKQ